MTIDSPPAKAQTSMRRFKYSCIIEAKIDGPPLSGEKRSSSLRYFHASSSYFVQKTSRMLFSIYMVFRMLSWSFGAMYCEARERTVSFAALPLEACPWGQSPKDMACPEKLPVQL